MPVEPTPCAPGGGGSAPGAVTTCCAPSIASTALCRPDGSTVLLVVRSGCAECGQDAPDPEIVGWLDPASGTFTPGPPPPDAGPCSAQPCPPIAMCPGLLGLSGPETWTMPDGTESLAVSVACGPVTVTDCEGNTTIVNECGTAFSWAAPGTGCAPGVLCGPVTVTVPEGAAAYIQWSRPCGTGVDL